MSALKYKKIAEVGNSFSEASRISEASFKPEKKKDLVEKIKFKEVIQKGCMSTADFSLVANY